ncbi:MAG: RecQ family ATP-dependent DNA helicase [Elusimicrobiota bacterium]|jgi:ATP-dependent DNA helicase RecQ|nr:RecQ family ATP-dependent DNA helicase [Elusimicrobiota bacterium]
MNNTIVFFDVETDFLGKKILDIGAVKINGEEYRSNDISAFSHFLNGAEYICGHNISNHDLKFVKDAVARAEVKQHIDTLYFSPLLFPSKPYHNLVKDYKLQSNELNNPLNDSKKAKDLFFDELSAFNKLDARLKSIYYCLLCQKFEFKHFFNYAGFSSDSNCAADIKSLFDGKICANADINKYIAENPIELSFSLALISAENRYSITPPWVIKNYPLVENIIYNLRGKRCMTGCDYCNKSIDPAKSLQRFFDYPSFRTYDNEPLQERAAAAAIDGKSLLAIFPTGGGKSITFQLPALVCGEAVRGLTVVLSPLQSLMKDQVDNLEQKGITDAVTINGALDPIERAKAFERVEDGSASILYISPESLRSKSIEILLLKRNIVRFVIDEAHCFSSWGQDFRVDYLYIGGFIKEYQNKKNLLEAIPVSCFTATAKQRVIEDIKNYFKEKLSINLELFYASTQRKNLKYYVFTKTTQEEKYQQLRTLLETDNCPAIIYVSRTRRAKELSSRLNEDGCGGGAVYYHGRLDRKERIENQDKFMRGEARVIVATTAFGMGVDKSNVGIVIHYDISTSLEDYVQEAGRAGRDEKISADCFVLFDDEDLNKHFILLNQTKLSIKEIKQIWKAIKKITRLRACVSKSALEIAREAGWDDSVNDIEMRVKTAVSALEESGFMKRGQNMPRIYANSILVKNMQEAVEKINASSKFSNDKERQDAVRIISKLIGAKHRANAGNDIGESRVDYISDMLGIVKESVIRAINLLREERILADAKDLTAFIKRRGQINKSLNILNEYNDIEKTISTEITSGGQKINLKELNKKSDAEIPLQKLKDVFNYLAVKQLIKRRRSGIKDIFIVKSNFTIDELNEKRKKRMQLARFIIEFLFNKSRCIQDNSAIEDIAVEFSCLELKEEYEHSGLFESKVSFDEIDDALFYLSKIKALRLDGAFLVSYNAMRIERTEQDNYRQYKKEDYKRLEEFYSNKIEQIHIVGEYAKRMTIDYADALQFVDDYFKLNYEIFIHKYFKGGREKEIKLNMTPQKFKQLFGELSPTQLKIINDAESKYIVVAAGPGSGKTKVLVHKLASLYMMEDVKHEQMLMLTFSRAAATEFKKRLLALIGNAANFIQITTFHSYCFDLLGKLGNLGETDKIIEKAVKQIQNGEIEQSKITKTVLVIDEAQDMSETEYLLVKALMDNNEELRVIAVGDDDQNIYEFRKSDSKYLKALITDYAAQKYELLDNYRSKRNIVALANDFAKNLADRIKETPSHAIQDADGEVIITKYQYTNLSIPVVDDILSKSLIGSICVLTETNDEAVTIAGLLIKKGITAKLIQDNAGFNLYNLVEVRYFVEALKLADDIYTIDEETWKNAKRLTKQEFGESQSYQYCANLIKDFEETNPKTKYKTDLLQFIRESKLEDFSINKDAAVIVSTIHKAKGREFDNVFLVLKQEPITDEKKRVVYVAMTRAKTNLYIHCAANVNCYDKNKMEIIPSIVRKIDDYKYPEPDEKILPARFKDIYLNSFYFNQKNANKIKSGTKLKIDYENGKYFCRDDRDNKVIHFSNIFQKKLNEQFERGYIPKIAEVKLIIWWQKQDDMDKKHPEVKILLPDIYCVLQK